MYLSIDLLPHALSQVKTPDIAWRNRPATRLLELVQLFVVQRLTGLGAARSVADGLGGGRDEVVEVVVEAVVDDGARGDPEPCGSRFQALNLLLSAAFTPGVAVCGI